MPAGSKLLARVATITILHCVLRYCAHLLVNLSLKSFCQLHLRSDYSQKTLELCTVSATVLQGTKGLRTGYVLYVPSTSNYQANKICLWDSFFKSFTNMKASTSSIIFILSALANIGEASEKQTIRRLKKSKSKKKSSKSPKPIEEGGPPKWTKKGLEAIAWEDWTHFTGEGEAAKSSLYVKNFPFPGDLFTDDHLTAWQRHVDSTNSVEDLIDAGYLTIEHGMVASMDDYTGQFEKVPTLFSDPMILKESPIDYRLQFAADIGSTMIGESASRGRLVNPAGRRLREHFYRFPDQCDATPIALEVFMRLMM